MLLWMEHATIEVVLWASSVSMLLNDPILMVPPDFGFWAWASEGRASDPNPASPAADQPTALRTWRRLVSSRNSSLTTSNPSRLFIVGCLSTGHGHPGCRPPMPRRNPAFQFFVRVM